MGIEDWFWKRTVDAEKTRFKKVKVKHKIKDAPLPDDPPTPAGWEQHQASVPAVTALPVPRVTDIEILSRSGKMKAAKDESD